MLILGEKRGEKQGLSLSLLITRKVWKERPSNENWAVRKLQVFKTC